MATISRNLAQHNTIDRQVEAVELVNYGVLMKSDENNHKIQWDDNFKFDPGLHRGKDFENI